MGDPGPSKRVLPLADLKPTASSRAWVSIPNPNGIPLLATATSDKTVRVYSLLNFTLHSTLEGGHTRSVRSVAWKPGGKKDAEMTIASGSFDHTMGLWRRREVFAAGNDSGGLETEITRRHIDDDGASEVSSSGEDWEFSLVLEGHDSEIKTVAWSPSGQFLASCSRDKSIWIWEDVGDDGEDEWETIAVLQEHTGDVKFVIWRENDGHGEVLASASYDDSIRLWREVEDGEWECVAEIEGHEGTVWCLDWEPAVSQQLFETPLADGEERSRTAPRLLSASADCTIRVWTQAPTPPPPNKPSYFNAIPSTMRPAPVNEVWECTSTLPRIHSLPIYAVNWSKKTGRVVSASGDGKVVIYEEVSLGRTKVGGAIERSWIVLATLQGGHGPYEINHVTWCPRYDVGKTRDDEEIIITTGDDGMVRAWAIEEGPVVPTSAEDVSPMDTAA